MRGNSPAQFLGEGAVEIPPPYPTKGRGENRDENGSQLEKKDFWYQETLLKVLFIMGSIKPNTPTSSVGR